MTVHADVRAGVPPLPAPELIRDDVQRALREDVGQGDVTARLLPEQASAQAHVLCREPAVIAGIAWFEACFKQCSPAVHIDWLVHDGDPVAAGDIICRMHGPARALVTAERSAINFLQTLSATATTAARHVDAVRGTSTRILDTRKTLPGLRAAQKYAVACGGACNHRHGLFDAYLVKENHIAACGGLFQAVRTARDQHPELLLEVEVENLDELEQALAAGVDRIMLDNFSHPQLLQAVARTAGRVPLEVSGNVSLEQLRNIAETGVDYISVGALTKHVRAVDFSMRLEMDASD